MGDTSITKEVATASNEMKRRRFPFGFGLFFLSKRDNVHQQHLKKKKKERRKRKKICTEKEMMK